MRPLAVLCLVVLMLAVPISRGTCSQAGPESIGQEIGIITLPGRSVYHDLTVRQQLDALALELGKLPAGYIIKIEGQSVRGRDRTEQVWHALQRSREVYLYLRKRHGLKQDIYLSASMLPAGSSDDRIRMVIYPDHFAVQHVSRAKGSTD